MNLDWNALHVRLNWADCGRLRWPRGLTHDPYPGAETKDNDLVYVWAGRGKLTLRGGEAELVPGACLWFRPGWQNRAWQDPQQPVGLTYIHFDLLDRRGRLIPPRHEDLPPEVLRSMDPALMDAVTRRVAEVCLAGQATGAPAAGALLAVTRLFEGLLRDLVEQNLRLRGDSAGPDAHETARRVCGLIHEQLATPLSVPELARQAGYSQSHLTRLFRAVTGFSPRAYWIAARIARARQLLLDPHFSVSQVAAQLGYADLYAFSRQFKRHTGLSPSAHRARR